MVRVLKQTKSSKSSKSSKSRIWERREESIASHVKRLCQAREENAKIIKMFEIPECPPKIPMERKKKKKKKSTIKLKKSCSLFRRIRASTSSFTAKSSHSIRPVTPVSLPPKSPLPSILKKSKVDVKQPSMFEIKKSLKSRKDIPTVLPRVFALDKAKLLEQLKEQGEEELVKSQGSKDEEEVLEILHKIHLPSGIIKRLYKNGLIYHYHSGPKRYRRNPGPGHNAVKVCHCASLTELRADAILYYLTNWDSEEERKKKKFEEDPNEIPRHRRFIETDHSYHSLCVADALKRVLRDVQVPNLSDRSDQDIELGKNIRKEFNDWVETTDMSNFDEWLMPPPKKRSTWRRICYGLRAVLVGLWSILQFACGDGGRAWSKATRRKSSNFSYG